jgi:hypothetical protein
MGERIGVSRDLLITTLWFVGSFDELVPAFGQCLAECGRGARLIATLVHVGCRSSGAGGSAADDPVAESVRSRLPIGLDHGCAAKTWATAPPLNTVVLVGAMVSGARKSRSPAPRKTGWTTRRYSSIRPVWTSDRAKRTPP